jgi:ferritin-like metal-binding protein YciE
MADVQSLRTHLITELRDLLDAEQQLTRALPDFASRASTPALRTAFERHLQETEGHVRRLTQVFETLGERAQSKRCEGMQGLIREGNSVVSATPKGALRDAVMITSAQKVEHYEIASYGTARTYATVLGESRVADLLEMTLQEEKNADAKLTSIAETKVNDSAAAAWHRVAPDFVQQTATLAGRAMNLGSRAVQRATAIGGPGKHRGKNAGVVEQVTATLNRAIDSSVEMANDVATSTRTQARRLTTQTQSRRTSATSRKPSAKSRSRAAKGTKKSKRR